MRLGGSPWGTGGSSSASIAASATRLSRAALLTILLLSAVPSLADDAVQQLGRVEERVGLAAPVEGLLRTVTRDLAADLATMPLFFRKTDLRLRLRSYYLDKENSNRTTNEAWAGGGSLAYESGPILGSLSIGAVGYTSQPIYAPDDDGGTGLLAPGQKGITVLGEAYGRLRFGPDESPHAILTGYRQLVDDGYVNKQDSRMIPNAFEGVTLGGQVGPVTYNLGYLWDIKPRNSDEFISMSAQAIASLPPAQQARAAGPDEGLVLTSIVVGEKKPLPHPNKYMQLGNYYVPDLLNTLFAAMEYEQPLDAEDTRRVSVALQYTDQRSVGDERLGIFTTGNVGARARCLWKTEQGNTFTLEAAGHLTSDNATIRSPYGGWPGYLSLLQTDFNRAGEKAWGLSGRYEIKLEGDTSLSLFVAYAQGTDRRDPRTGKNLPTTREGDVDVIYKYKKVAPKGELRLRGGFMDDAGARLSYQLRLILNYEVDLL